MKSGWQKTKGQLNQGWVLFSILAVRLSIILRAVLPAGQFR